jgi:hypothetical protein
MTCVHLYPCNYRYLRCTHTYMTYIHMYVRCTHAYIHTYIHTTHMGAHVYTIKKFHFFDFLIYFLIFKKSRIINYTVLGIQYTNK